MISGDWIAKSAQRLATDWAVHVWITGREWNSVFPISIQTGPRAHPASCKMGIGSLSQRWSGRNVVLTTNSHLAPMLGIRTALPLLPLWASMARYGETFSLSS